MLGPPQGLGHSWQDLGHLTSWMLSFMWFILSGEGTGYAGVPPAPLLNLVRYSKSQVPQVKKVTGNPVRAEGKMPSFSCSSLPRENSPVSLI